MTRALVATVLLSCHAVVFAQPSPKVYGVGVESCSEWLAPPAQGGAAQMQAMVQRVAVIAWATGYVTGAAATLATHGVVLKDTTGTDIEAHLTTHCTKSPTDTIEQAMVTLVKSLHP